MEEKDDFDTTFAITSYQNQKPSCQFLITDLVINIRD